MAALLQLQSNGRIEGGLQSYDMPLHGRVLYDLRGRLEDLRLPLVQLYDSYERGWTQPYARAAAC